MIIAAIALLSMVGVVSAANINCTVFDRTSVPAGWVKLMNLYKANDSHAELVGVDTYDKTIACKSNITSLNANCAVTYINVTHLFNDTNAHVSVDGYYDPLGHQVCLGTTNDSIEILKDVSATTGPGFDCAFGLWNYSNSHVFECDESNLNFNILVRSNVTDTDPPITSDNHTLGPLDWYMETSHILLSVLEPHFAYSEYCIFDAGDAACVPTTKNYTKNSIVQIQAPSNGVRKVFLTYHSVDSFSNNESYHNTTVINLVGGSDIYNSLLNNSNVTSGSVIIDSTLNNSYVQGCYVENSIIINSSLINGSGYRYPCRIINSTVVDSNITSVSANNSYVDPSVITDSLIINSTVNDSNITSSIVLNSSFCAPMTVTYGIVTSDVLTGGQIQYGGATFYPVTPFTTICGALPNITFISPTPGSILNGTINILFESSQNNSPEISIDGGAWQATDDWNYHTIDTTTYEDGTHTVKLRDRDTLDQFVYSNLISYTFENALPGLTFVKPVSGDLLLGLHEVQVLAADYIRKVEFRIYNASGWYGLDGTAGVATEDTDSSDGWNSMITTSVFGGHYNLTATAYSRTFFGGYEYNATANVTDLYVDRDLPSGSIEIWGTNDTIKTNIVNVVLNLSFSDDGGVKDCRFANDLESILATQPWEPCVSSKAWLLSGGEGEKWVYYEVRDESNNTAVFNDSIFYIIAPDLTPPTAPTVYDGTSGSDIDVWNDNESLGAYWFNATEDISTLNYRYRILENASCYGGDCNYTDAGTDVDVTVEDLNLTECTNYSFEVMAYNPSGLNSTTDVSDGVLTDFTLPARPDVESETHPDENEVYGSSYVKLNWSSQDGGVCPSGIEGYSFILDRYPGTAPDENEDESTVELARLEPGQYSQLLKESGAGDGYNVMTEVRGNLSTNDVVKVRWMMFEDEYETIEDMGIEVGIYDDECSSYGSCGTQVAYDTFDDDVRYVGSVGSASVYEMELTASVGVTDDSFFVMIRGANSDTDNTNNVSIPWRMTQVDNSTTTKVCQEGGSCVLNQSIEFSIGVEVFEEGTNSISYTVPGDGVYYFHVRAKDNAGNWGDTRHYKLDIDTAGIGIDIIEPFNGQMFTTPYVPVVVEVNEPADVNISVLHADGSVWDSAVVTVNDSYSFNATIENGTNEIIAQALNTDNGIVTQAQSVYVTYGSYYVDLDKTLKVTVAGAGDCGNHIRCLQPGGYTLGVATENDGAAFGAGDIAQDTSRYSFKIFMTNPSMPLGDVEKELDQDEFLDRKNPIFGYERDKVKKYLIATEVRSPIAHFYGTQKVNTGKYKLVFKNVGYTPDGKANITVTIV